MGTTIGKVWGTSTTVAAGQSWEVHHISVVPGGFCSDHRHIHKFNAFHVTRGDLHIKRWAKVDEPPLVTTLGPGDTTVIEPGVVHRFEAGPDGCECIEVYYAESIGSDIVRYSGGGVKK
jgi:quercetin dioxygenase-like cupin family protein